MSLIVQGVINGRVLYMLECVNQGHPETGERPADDDLRTYTVAVMDGEGAYQCIGTVDHRRGHGAAVLSRLALELMERNIPPRSI